MTSRISRLNPPELHETPGYHHITIAESGRTAYLAGQCPLDAAGKLVGAGDYDAQAVQVASNALAALKAIDASPEQVVRSVIYVVSPETLQLGAVWRTLHTTPLAKAFTTASTLLGVAQLGFTDQLIELDLTVAL
ncbi:RidA family protein [Tenggerimyces flavus]|uniref:RidA family protein n=1 Tax=Tenggerimyces flavus TaxID=1708749 RepID=A0ABV7YF51_9ACTN|nr:RidA family protein [Tenggerimyces flavus]MBM7787871.1 enamine deaminase RidA (YjgF/YER057c/UK114 family) [Tenggerimyces flavus]